MRTYTQEEKQAVIDRVISSEPSAHILADTGIPKSTFYSWLRIYQEEQNAANRRKVDIRNFHLLENKVARLESIVEILKSAPCTPKAPLRQRLYAAEQLYGKYNTSPYDKLQLDLMYIENYSLLLDIRLLLMTVKIMFIKESTEGFSKEESKKITKKSKSEKK